MSFFDNPQFANRKTPLTDAEFRRLFDYWRQRLGVRRDSVRLRRGISPHSDRWLDVDAKPTGGVFDVRYTPSLLSQPVQKSETLIIHEQLHIALYPMTRHIEDYAEHNRLFRETMLGRIREGEEAVVTALAKRIYNLGRMR